MDQIAELELEERPFSYPFRCIGLRTDMKAKIFEWIDASSDVPAAMLQDEGLTLEVQEAINIATK